ncbi:MAG: ABC transporter ATP-binding protein [Alphaproteobacteria bacterium]|nr:ABC transporter ATP-binding protein [Alphaproteobacteria bacterium]
MNATRPVAVRLSDVTLAYDRHPAVHHVSGAFAPGALNAVVGPNGAGKTTLLRAIAGELALQEGRIDRDGLSRHDIAYLPQQATLDRSFPINVLDVVVQGAYRRIGLFTCVRRETIAEAERAIDAVGLSGFEDRPLSTLSAGQFQRTLFARVLLQDARLILLDEPFNAIDARTTADLMELMRRWRGEHRTVIAVLHDLDLVRSGFDEALLLARSAVAWGPPVEALAAQNQLRARAMSESWDPDADLCHGAA